MENTERKIVIDFETSRRITSLRFLLAVFVVFIHNNFTVESIAESVALGGAEILFNQNAFGRWVQLFISSGIARCAVPLFFLFAAYLQARKNDSYGVLIKKKAKSLVLPYFLWVVIYGFYSAGVKLIVLKFAPQFVQHPENTALNWTLLDWVHKIFGYSAEKGAGELPGFVYQFWFIRDLVILTLISPVINFFMKKFPRGFFLFVSILFIAPVNVYFVQTQALFFYTAGLYWGTFDFPLFEKIDKIRWGEASVLFLMSFFSEWTFCDGTGKSAMYWCAVLCACVLFLKLSAVIVHSEKAFSILSYLSAFSFWLYAIHTPVLNEMLKRIWLKFFPMKNPFFCLAEYFGVTLLTVAIGTALGILLKKICPKFFALLTGGRG
ncbi:acyltransferase family protein [Treponema sp.]|uniref:acyltransferase family protein n=1 Tax=Treponema sp. TaxID=166 RepID=UPI003F02C3E3